MVKLAPPIVRIVSVFAISALVGAVSPMASAATAPTTVYSAVTNFSVARNPNGTWTYLAAGSPLGSVDQGCNALGLACRWNGQPVCNSASIAAGTTGRPISHLTIRLPVDHLNLDPESINNVAVRWTAPASGSFEIQGDFLGVDTSEQSHPVAIRDEVTTIYSNKISAFGQRLAFNLTRTLRQGETVDFVVYTGSACTYLSTGLKATIKQVATASTTTMPNIAGQFVCAGLPCGSGVATIQQSGSALTLTNEKGMVSKGQFASANVIVADDWGDLHGTISADRNTISWANATSWARSSGGGGTSTGGLPASFKPCYKNAGAYAAAGPCFGPAGTMIYLELLRPMPKLPEKLVFRAVVANGVPAQVTAALAASGSAYSLSAPPQLCTGPTFPHKWMIWLMDASGAMQGEIGEFTMTACP